MINYDTPVYSKTYVHRVGRTARAGRAGRAFTILRKEEVGGLTLALMVGRDCMVEAEVKLMVEVGVWHTILRQWKKCISCPRFVISRAKSCGRPTTTSARWAARRT